MSHPIVSPETWAEARAALLAEEKALTHEADRVAAVRRRLPWVKVDKDYRFQTPQGPATLADLFDGRRQLILYHHMLKPADASPCSGCCMVMDQLPHLSHLHARDTTLVVVSKAPLAEITAFADRMDWTTPWVETLDNLSADFGLGERGPGFTVFIREGDAIYHTYATTARELERSMTVWGLLDMTPMGRQETWQDAPPWVPQDAPYRWWRRHDDYADA